MRPHVNISTSCRPGPYIAGAQLFFFSNIVFDWKPCLYTGDPCEGLWSLPPQTKNPRYDPFDMTTLVCAIGQ